MGVAVLNIEEFEIIVANSRRRHVEHVGCQSEIHEQGFQNLYLKSPENRIRFRTVSMLT